MVEQVAVSAKRRDQKLIGATRLSDCEEFLAVAADRLNAPRWIPSRRLNEFLHFQHAGAIAQIPQFDDLPPFTRPRDDGFGDDLHIAVFVLQLLGRGRVLREKVIALIAERGADRKQYQNE